MALSFIPVSGDGLFTITIKNLRLYAHTFLVYEKEMNLLKMKDLDMNGTYTYGWMSSHYFWTVGMWRLLSVCVISSLVEID